jgi:MgtC family
MDWHVLFVDELAPDSFWRVLARLGAAMVFGGLLGIEREVEAKPAGMRTHMLVALGAAAFILGPLEAGVPLEQLMRVIQGLIRLVETHHNRGDVVPSSCFVGQRQQFSTGIRGIRLRL